MESTLNTNEEAFPYSRLLFNIVESITVKCHYTPAENTINMGHQYISAAHADHLKALAFGTSHQAQSGRSPQSLLTVRLARTPVYMNEVLPRHLHSSLSLPSSHLLTNQRQQSTTATVLGKGQAGHRH